MSLLFADGFDHYAAAALLRKWSTAGTWYDMATTGGRYGTGCLRQNNPGGGMILTRAIPASSTVIVGIASKTDPSPYSDTQFITFLSGAAVQLYVGAMADGSVVVWRSVDGASTRTLLARTTRPVLFGGVWQYIEAKATPADSGGKLVVRVDGEVVIDYTGDTKYNSDTIDTVSMYLNRSNNNYTYFDDFYICDGLGSVNNDFLGDVRVITLLPNANGTNSDWTGSDGNSTDNYLLVDDPATGVDDETTHVKSVTVDQKDSYNFPASGLSAGAIIKGVQEVVTCRRESAGGSTKPIKGLCLSNGTEGLGSNFYPVSPYTMNRTIFEKDPDTNAAWGQAGLDAAEFGMKVSS